MTKGRCYYVTEELIRRRAEHNNCEILSLEEVSLHQQDIEKIEYIDKWCKELKILYLQNNIISRIENVNRLKKLEYLNLALNNIEVIENLEGCESLQKLDLTVNFIGKLSSIESLRHNLHLRELFLVGNPCTEFEGYRQFVVASVPQLKWLDGQEIPRSERIRAAQSREAVRCRVREQELKYLQKRAREKQEAQGIGEDQKLRKKKDMKNVLGSDGCWDTNINNIIPDENKENQKEQNPEQEPDSDREFWEKPCAFTPESRLEAHRHMEEKRRQEEKERAKDLKPKNPRTLVTKEGRVLNVNEPKLDFSLRDDTEVSQLVLDLAVYRHMDTSLLDVDVQPTYIRVTVKGKVFQLVLPAEVLPDSSTAQRSQTTGHLVVTMPTAHGEITQKTMAAHFPRVSAHGEGAADVTGTVKGVQRLEVDPSKHSGIDLANIVPRERSTGDGPLRLRTTPEAAGACDSEDFEDDPEVPPLM
nr:protein tilB homolog isoform X1 [Paramormyrops kingsleyae]